MSHPARNVFLVVCDVIITPQVLIYVLFFSDWKLKSLKRKKKRKGTLLSLFSERDIFFLEHVAFLTKQLPPWFLREKENGRVKSVLKFLWRPQSAAGFAWQFWWLDHLKTVVSMLYEWKGMFPCWYLLLGLLKALKKMLAAS